LKTILSENVTHYTVYNYAHLRITITILFIMHVQNVQLPDKIYSSTTRTYVISFL